MKQVVNIMDHTMWLETILGGGLPAGITSQKINGISSKFNEIRYSSRFLVGRYT